MDFIKYRPSKKEVVFAIVLFCFLVFLFSFGPHTMVALDECLAKFFGSQNTELTSQARQKTVDRNRNMLLTVLGGAAAMIVLITALARARASTRIAAISVKGHLTSGFARAIEQIGDQNPTYQLGGLMSLHWLAKEVQPLEEAIRRDPSKADLPVDKDMVAQLICMFIQLQLQDSDSDSGGIMSVEEALASRGTSKPIIQTALNIIGKEIYRPCNRVLDGIVLDHDYEFKGNYINVSFRSASLSRMRFASKVDFSEADFSESEIGRFSFEEISLVEAKFENSTLHGTKFLYCNLERGVLTRTRLAGARLYGVNLRNADLKSADLKDATLIRVDLRGANLTGAKNLIQSAWKSVWIDSTTTLPKTTGSDPIEGACEDFWSLISDDGQEIAVFERLDIGSNQYHAFHTGFVNDEKFHGDCFNASVHGLYRRGVHRKGGLNLIKCARNTANYAKFRLTGVRIVNVEGLGIWRNWGAGFSKIALFGAIRALQH